jgi:hypothetical protein
MEELSRDFFVGGQSLFGAISATLIALMRTCAQDLAWAFPRTLPATVSLRYFKA